MNSNEIRLIHNAIFCAPSDYAETPEDISIEMQDLVEFQGQGIAAEDGFVYADIKGKKICDEVLYDLKNTYPYSPFRHVNVFRTAGPDKKANLYWKCKYCNFYCELLDQYIIEKHLCCSCEKISLEDKNELKTHCLRQTEQHLIDLYK